MKHPIQPLYRDEHGTIRFKANPIVQKLLDWATERGFGLNEITVLNFDADDRRQFAQLIGYSHSGFGSLSYADDETYNTAEEMFRSGTPELQARNDYLEGELQALKDALADPMARLFQKHPDDFK